MSSLEERLYPPGGMVCIYILLNSTASSHPFRRILPELTEIYIKRFNHEMVSQVYFVLGINEQRVTIFQAKIFSIFSFYLAEAIGHLPSGETNTHVQLSQPA